MRTKITAYWIKADEQPFPIVLPSGRTHGYIYAVIDLNEPKTKKAK